MRNVSLATFPQYRYSPAVHPDPAVRRHKGIYGVPLGPQADDLMYALLGNDHERAVGVLMRAANNGWALADVEDLIIEPAVTRLGQLWLRGRLPDDAFNQVGTLAEQVEWAFRQRLVGIH
jgi:hypothetical protein